jgi:aspartyl-tRNA(Asn)/glutamyl-tRNA(Gln) amidotransferase subunit C
MKITTQEVLHVADLARLRIDHQVVDKLAEQVATILNYVDKLGEVQTDDVPPATHATAMTNAFREDLEKGHLKSEQVFDNAPAREKDFFVVPKVI